MLQVTPARSGKWSKDEVKRLRKMFPNRSTLLVAVRLQRSVPSVKAKAYALGLRKTKKHLESIGRGH
jgi:hypothetical protein